MGLLDTLVRKINDDSSNYVQFGIPPERVQNVRYDATPVGAGGGYFRLWAVEIRVGEGGPLANFYPVLHSVIRFDYAGKSLELTHVTGLDTLKSSVGSKVEMSKVVALNFPLTDLIPFNGGTVELSAGLLAMKEKDKVQSVIRMASDFSALLAVPQLSSVLALAQPLANNIERLVGLGDNQFRLGYHNTFASANGGGSNDLRPQYLAIIAAHAGDGVPRDGAGHWVINDHLCYINPDPNAPNKAPVDIPRDYMLFRLEVRRSRDAEWNNLSDLNTPFIDALRLLTNDSTKAAAQLKRAILQVLESPDIAENDREPIARLLHKKYKEREAVLNLEAIPIPGEVEKLPTMAETLKDLGSANADTNPMSVNQLLEV